MNRQNWKRQLQNAAIFLTVIAGIRNIFLSLPVKIGLLDRLDLYYDTRVTYQAAALHGILSFMLGFLMLFLANRLYKRIRFAWAIEIAVLFSSVLLRMIRGHAFFTAGIALELLVLLILLLSHRDFSRQTDRITFKWACIAACISIGLVLVNAAVGILLMRQHYHEIGRFGDALIRSVELLIFMDTSVSEFKTRAGMLYADSLITINWGCILFSAFLILKPLVYNPIMDKRAKERVRELVLKYGWNDMSYLALENDKKYYFGSSVNGVAAFTVASDVAVCCGDIICADEDAKAFLAEFLAFCRQNGWDTVLINVGRRFLPVYKNAGFGCVKYGENALFDLHSYTLAGKKAAKVRAAIHHADREGITVLEYKPGLFRDIGVENEINALSKIWQKGKKSGEMSFMLGGVGLDNPMDRRYFTARDTNGRMLGFCVFLPYLAGKAFLADVTRRLPDAPQGVIEKLIFEGFMTMKNEGAEWGSMGLCPLHNMQSGDRKGIAARLFEFVYENLNNLYGFKALHHSKEKFGPTEWETRYLVYYPSLFTPRIAYSIVKAQNPKGISDYLLTALKKQSGKPEQGQKEETAQPN